LGAILFLSLKVVWYQLVHFIQLLNLILSDFSPFGIDGERIKSPEGATELKIFKEAYSTISNIMDLLTSFYNSGKMRGVYVNPKKAEHIIELGDYIITAKQIGPPAFSIDFGKSLENVGKIKFPLLNFREKLLLLR
jgi:hypothetical protein